MSELSEFHHTPEQLDLGKSPKFAAGALVVALMLGGAGVYAYSSSMAPKQAAKPVVASNKPMPPPAMPASQAPSDQAASLTPDSSATPDANAAPAPVAAPVKAADAAKPQSKLNQSRPIKSASSSSSSSTRMARNDAPAKSGETGHEQQAAKTDTTANPTPSNTNANRPSDSSQANAAAAPDTSTAAVPAAPSSGVANNGQVTAPETTTGQSATPSATPEPSAPAQDMSQPVQPTDQAGPAIPAQPQQ